jgi:formylglycine-generating enzyme required for sulfatase activity
MTPIPATCAAVAALLLLAGCNRSAPASNPAAPTNPAPAAAAASPSATAPALDDMVPIPAGTFEMGEKTEPDAPPHAVRISAFLIDRTPVTQALYEKVMGENPSRWKVPRNPVEQVRWSDAVRFCNKRSELDHLEPCYNLTNWSCNFDASGYRLPTEAEWEYACRAGTTTTFYFDDASTRLGEHAWFDRNAGGRPHPVGEKRPNAWGLYDMCGNVWQWCQDLYQADYYTQAPRQDPRGPATGRTRVVRGGAWRSGPDTCRAGYRYNENPGYADVCFGYDIYGFRCVRKPTASR